MRQYLAWRKCPKSLGMKLRIPNITSRGHCDFRLRRERPTLQTRSHWPLVECVFAKRNRHRGHWRGGRAYYGWQRWNTFCSADTHRWITHCVRKSLAAACCGSDWTGAHCRVAQHRYLPLGGACRPLSARSLITWPLAFPETRAASGLQCS